MKTADYKKIFVLTGAGVSAESGLKTFRDADGLWEGHRVEEVATPEAFERNPDLVYDFYNQRRRQLLSSEVQPNGAHRALAEFEKNYRNQFLLVTQNVDDLHERAGSRRLFHMHGELLKARCCGSEEVFDWRTDLDANSPHPKKLGHALRPHIVWFGEMPFYMDEISNYLRNCDLFVAIGTSGLVYPAAGFVRMVPLTCRKVEINLRQTDITGSFDEAIEGPASSGVAQLFLG